MSENAFYGWYDDASQAPDQPSYDPPHDTPCLYCGLALDPENDIRTISIMMQARTYAQRAYFYRVHRTCDMPESGKMDGFIWDMIERNGD